VPHNRRLVVASSVVALAGIGGRAYAAATAARRTVKATIPPVIPRPAPVLVSVPKEPELISARATNGMVGFVKKSDLEAKPGLKAATKQAATSQLIPVYARDGRTVIGKYVVEAGETETQRS